MIGGLFVFGGSYTYNPRRDKNHFGVAAWSPESLPGRHQRVANSKHFLAKNDCSALTALECMKKAGSATREGTPKAGNALKISCILCLLCSFITLEAQNTPEQSLLGFDRDGSVRQRALEKRFDS